MLTADLRFLSLCSNRLKNNILLEALLRLRQAAQRASRLRHLPIRREERESDDKSIIKILCGLRWAREFWPSFSDFFCKAREEKNPELHNSFAC
jgi:hypothetical protein